MLRNVFNLDRTTHRYVLETLTDIPHLYVQLLGRFVTFVKSLLANDAFEVRFLANLCLTDMTTVVGRSIAKIMDLCNHYDMTTLNARLVKKSMSYMVMPMDEEWRIGIIADMRNLLTGNSSNLGLTNEEAKCILDFACVS